jgi:hypothetical protein
MFGMTWSSGNTHNLHNNIDNKLFYKIDFETDRIFTFFPINALIRELFPTTLKYRN